MPSNWYKRHFLFLCNTRKKEGGEKRTNVKIGKRSFQQWSWVVLAPSPPHFFVGS